VGEHRRKVLHIPRSVRLTSHRLLHSLTLPRLYKDRLDRLEREEASLTADIPYHPEYLNMKQCIDDRLAERLRQINKEHEYTLQAHERVGVARKAEIWSQFYQTMREKREEFLDQLNRDWYETQNARRSAHSVQDYALLFPASDAHRTRNAVAYNTEVSILSGIAKHVGFPAAPAMRGASAAEIEEDLEAIKVRTNLTRRVHCTCVMSTSLLTPLFTSVHGASGNRL